MNPKMLAGLIALVLSPTVMASSHIDARSAGMAGTGIASGDFTRANLNPALLTRFEDNDDFYFKLAFGVEAQNYRDVMDEVKHIQNDLENFEQKVDAQDPANLPTAADAQRLVDGLERLGTRHVDGDAVADLAIYLPSKRLAMGMNIGSQVWTQGNFEFAQADKDMIEGAIKVASLVDNMQAINSSSADLKNDAHLHSAINDLNNTNIDSLSGGFNLDDIQSSGLVRAVAVTDVSLSFASQIPLPVLGHLAVGVTPKAQRLDTYVYQASVSNYDKGDFLDEQNMTHKMTFNFDLGLHAELGMAQIGIVARNLIEQEIVNNKGEHLALKPTITAATSVQWYGMTLEADLDLIQDKSFVLQDTSKTLMLPRQWARIGAEIDIFEQAQLRAGYKTDLSGNYGDLFTVGLGLSPFDTLTLDLAGQFGQKDERGATLQLGFKF